MEAYRTSFALARRESPLFERLGLSPPPLPDLDPASLGLQDGTPFLVSPDGLYDIHLNRYLRDLPNLGVRKRNSQAAYTQDIALWARYLGEQTDVSVWGVTKDHVAAYKMVRKIGDMGGISARTWNRSLAALQSLYRWGLEEGLIDRLPFRYRNFSAGYERPQRVVRRRNLAEHPEDDAEPLRYVSLQEFVLWRDVGLRGFGADGKERAHFHGRNVGRNVALFETLLTKGLRIEEALGVLRPEWDFQKRTALIPGLIRKNGDSLRVGLTPRIVMRFKEYIELERRISVRRGLERHPAFGISNPVYLVQGEGDRVRRIDGGSWMKLREIPAEDRPRIIFVSEDGSLREPGATFLTESGRPLDYDGVRQVYDAANARCARLGFAIRITPHVLRHTFAINMLEHLIRKYLDLDTRAKAAGSGRRGYVQAFGEPLRHLQRLLGHRRITSTYVYLDYLDDVRDLIEEALKAWDDELFATEAWHG